LISGDPAGDPRQGFALYHLGYKDDAAGKPWNPWNLKRSGLKFGEKFVSHRTHGLHDKTFDMTRLFNLMYY